MKLIRSFASIISREYFPVNLTLIVVAPYTEIQLTIMVLRFFRETLLAFYNVVWAMNYIGPLSVVAQTCSPLRRKNKSRALFCFRIMHLFDVRYFW